MILWVNPDLGMAELDNVPSATTTVG